MSNLQLAWEVLEVARYIFTLKTDKENEIKSSQVLNKLGELGIEGGCVIITLHLHYLYKYNQIDESTLI